MKGVIKRLKDMHFFISESEATKIARINAKLESKRLQLESKVKIQQIQSDTPKRSIIKRATLTCSLIIALFITIIVVSSFFILKVGCVDLNRILGIAATTLSIVLSIIAIIFTFNSGLNLENYVHDIDKMNGEIKALSRSISSLQSRLPGHFADNNIQDPSTGQQPHENNIFAHEDGKKQSNGEEKDNSPE